MGFHYDAIKDAEVKGNTLEVTEFGKQVNEQLKYHLDLRTGKPV
jgi:hypothetical protein